MNILLLGGTGAIGRSLAPILLKQEYVDLFITSRRGQESDNPRLVYYKCNAMDNAQLKEVLKSNTYDVIVDFMNYHTAEFKERHELLLSSTLHYIFLSSCRVFADQPIINESSVQLLDALKGDDYLKQDTYTLAKARCERILMDSKQTNYTIVRPYITYNTNRFQLGIYEKEHFLYRALRGRPIVVSKDILDKQTSMTSSGDVARLIAKIIQLPPTGKSYNLASTETVTWKRILDIYVDGISSYLGKSVKVKIIDNSERASKFIYSEEKYHYDRLYNRHFKSEESIVKSYAFAPVADDLRKALDQYCQSQSYGSINWEYEAYLDSISHTTAGYSEFPTMKSFVHYILRKFKSSN